MDKKQRIELMENIKVAADEIISETKAQLEPAKPALRHGDYGHANKDGCDARLWVEDRNGSKQWCDPNNVCDESEPIQFETCTVLGNIFDDLAVMSEDVEEFEVADGRSSLRVKLLSDGKVQFYIRGGEIAEIRLDATTKAHRKLGALIATAIRKK